ncbi:unnamed protein product [Kuraishia capsulata CBS 1993]|uniref:BZIP domain-containing protein n=1 Tax=Kuraishia capsulata CBS 1993 TaxID=1382522 RepID=W6MNC4_9ASCO|nr:uncharacterized protein KUCA_T00004145001 [Kuraishia capsulata CBS 1993]CDK28164.1 unnamed protein product [Kuraishia capsulata CBS 1993]
MSTAADLKPGAALPPRKRARTQEEKEQRRVERILRNRRAAHASREKKRKHVEFLEEHVNRLEDSISVYRSNEDRLKEIQTELISRLSKLGGDVSDLDLTLTPVIVVDRVGRLEMDEDDESDLDDDTRPAKEVKSAKLQPKEPQFTVPIKRKPEDYYLSPPLSNLDSTSPSNFVLKLEGEDDITSNYYKSPLPLFDEEDLIVPSNLELKHSSHPEMAENEDSEEQLLSGLTKTDSNRLHHPAVMIVHKEIYGNGRFHRGIETADLVQVWRHEETLTPFREQG